MTSFSADPNPALDDICWDALIVKAARRAGATTLFTEDLQHRVDFDGVVVENPFRGL